MYANLVLWNLDASDVGIEDLRAYLRDYAVDAYAKVDGLRLKAWISDPRRNLWGAFYLWDRPEAMPAIYTVSKVVDLIGYPPTSVGGFEIEAVAEGRSAHALLTGLGLAFDDEGVTP